MHRSRPYDIHMTVFVLTYNFNEILRGKVFDNVTPHLFEFTQIRA